MSNLPFAITISRQLGSGAAYLGQLLAEQLGILYLDREILFQAAQQLKVFEEELTSRDETKQSFWESLLQLCVYDSPEIYIPPELYIPSDQELYQVESEIIQKVVQGRSAVIIGRGGSYVLREHPRHVSIFLHADIAFRRQRIAELYNLSAQDATKIIQKSDQARARYFQALSGQNWLDTGNYHLSIDTGSIGLDKTQELILIYLKHRFGNIMKNDLKLSGKDAR